MKTLNYLLLVTILILCAGPAMADGDTETRTFDVKPGGTLDLDFDSGGSASVEGWDKNEVRITWSDEMNDAEDWDVEFKTSGGGLRMIAELNNRRIHSSSLHADIMVPSHFDIKMASAGGSLHVTGVEGRFSGKTAGGSLVLHDVVADVKLSSGGGGIEVTDSRVDGRMSTGGGKVLVKNVVGDLKASSGGGDVRYVNVRNDDGDLVTPGGRAVDGLGEKTVMITNAGGRIVVKEAPEGAVVSTGGGNVRIRNAEKFVKASTGGGDITIDLGKGWATASTGAGDIELRIDKDGGDGDIELSTGYGDVTLIVPADFGMTLDVDLRYTRESSRDFDVDSDFDVTIERTDEWERLHGMSNWVKRVYVEDEVNGGGQTVKITTTNGNVYIKRK